MTNISVQAKVITLQNLFGISIGIFQKEEFLDSIQLEDILL
jgi:hypothetical protein